MTEKNIVLVGFMGSGKSKVSQKLSQMTGRVVYSTDEEIERKEGVKIAEIFQKRGEPYFRQQEREAVRNIAGKSGLIIDCGGGIVIDQDNIDDLKKNGILFYLSASPDFLLSTIKLNKNRPLMQVEDPLAKIREMLKARQKFYKQADFTVVSENKTINQISKEIMEIMNNE